MSQLNQSNASAEVFRVFGRSQRGQGKPSSSINQPHYISVSTNKRLIQSDCNNKFNFQTLHQVHSFEARLIIILAKLC